MYHMGAGYTMSELRYVHVFCVECQILVQEFLDF